MIKYPTASERDRKIDRLESELREARAAIERVRALADDMQTWCSPHGISVEYAKRIHEAVDGRP